MMQAVYLQREDELGGCAEAAEEGAADAPPELGGGVDAAEEQALPVHAHQRARQQRGGVCKERGRGEIHATSVSDV